MGGKPLPPKTLTETIFENILFFSQQWNLSPFELLQIDIEDLFLFSSFLANKARNNTDVEQKPKPKEKDAFWDF